MKHSKSHAVDFILIRDNSKKALNLESKWLKALLWCVSKIIRVYFFKIKYRCQVKPLYCKEKMLDTHFFLCYLSKGADVWIVK